MGRRVAFEDRPTTLQKHLQRDVPVVEPTAHRSYEDSSYTIPFEHWTAEIDLILKAFSSDNGVTVTMVNCSQKDRDSKGLLLERKYIQLEIDGYNNVVTLRETTPLSDLDPLLRRLMTTEYSITTACYPDEEDPLGSS